MKRSDPSADSKSAQALGTGHQSLPERTPRILIAEDHPTERDYLKTVLNYAGYEVLEATDGLAALNMALSHRPDLVISDILMPKLDGLEFVRRMRSDPETATIRIIIWSASFKQSEAQVMAESLGVARYLKKPVEPDTLLFTVKETLNAPPPPRVLPAVLNKLDEAHQRLIGDQLYRKSLELEEELATRQQIENALRESERRLAGLIDSAMDAIISIDVEQRITIFNKAAQTMFRCQAYEAIGSPLERFIPDRFRADHREYVRHFAESGATSRAMGQTRPVWGLRADGEEFPIDASISKVYVEGHWQLTVILRDITERQRTEQALQDSERRLSLALNASGSSVWDLEVASGKLNYLGRFAEDTLGYAAAELTTLAQWMGNIHQDDRPGASEMLGKLIHGQLDNPRLEFRLRARDGTWHWVLSQAVAAERDTKGQAIRVIGTTTDITERKHTEERLKESDSYLRQLVATLPGMVWATAPDGACNFVSQQWQEYTGMPLESLLGDGWLAPFHPEDRERVAQAFQHAAETGTDYNAEYRLRRHDGKYRWFKSRGRAQRDSVGNIIRWLGFILDIEDRIHAEAALRRSQEHLSLALDAAQMVAYQYSEPTDRVIRKGQAIRDLGLEAEGSGTDYFARVHPEDKESFLGVLKGLTREQPDYHVEYRIQIPDGSHRWLSDHAKGDFNEHEEFIGAHGVILDITDHKQNELALTLNTERQTLLLDIAANILHAWGEKFELSQMIFSTIGKHLDADICFNYRLEPGTDRMELIAALGVAADVESELHGLRVGQTYCGTVAATKQPLNITHAQIEADPQAEFARRLRLRSYMGHPLIGFDGEVMGVLAFGSTLRDHFTSDDQNLLQTIAYLLSLAWERRRAEVEIKRLNADLEHRVEERTAALVKSNLELQRFAYISAHDLQTPLRSIASFTQLLNMQLKDQLNPETSQFMRYVLDNTKRMQTLIKDLLAYSRLDSQARPYEEIDLGILMEEVLGSLAGIIKETGARVTFGEMPIIFGDRSQIAQVFTNLIENGIKYNKAEQIEVEVSAKLENGEWIFAVRDNGIGIDSRHQAQIFTAFKRLHAYHQYPGSGVGLAICQRVVERHGGRIWLESAQGAGSTFYFTLPTRLEELA